MLGKLNPAIRAVKNTSTHSKATTTATSTTTNINHQDKVYY